MLRNYSDILLTDLASVRDVIEEQEGVRTNLTETRCIVSFIGSLPQKLIDLGCVLRSKAEAVSYYDNHTNGWVEEF